jgi:hypothetical protein
MVGEIHAIPSLQGSVLEIPDSPLDGVSVLVHATEEDRVGAKARGRGKRGQVLQEEIPPSMVVVSVGFVLALAGDERTKPARQRRRQSGIASWTFLVMVNPPLLAAGGRATLG